MVTRLLVLLSLFACARLLALDPGSSTLQEYLKVDQALLVHGLSSAERADLQRKRSRLLAALESSIGQDASLPGWESEHGIRSANEEILTYPLRFFRQVFVTQQLSSANRNKFEQMIGSLETLAQQCARATGLTQEVLELMARYNRQLPSIFMGLELFALPMASLTGNARFISLMPLSLAQRQHHLLQVYYVITQHFLRSVEALRAEPASHQSSLLTDYRFSSAFYLDALVAYLVAGGLVVDRSSWMWRVCAFPYWYWQRCCLSGYLRELLASFDEWAERTERQDEYSALTGVRMRAYLDLVTRFDRGLYRVDGKAASEFTAELTAAIADLQAVSVFHRDLRAVMIARLLHVKQEVAFFQQGLQGLAADKEKQALYIKYRVILDDPLFAQVRTSQRFAPYADRFLAVMDQYILARRTTLEQSAELCYEIYALAKSLERLNKSLTPPVIAGWVRSGPRELAVLTDMQAFVEELRQVVDRQSTPGIFGEKGVVDKIMSGDWIQTLLGKKSPAAVAHMVTPDALKAVMNEHSSGATKILMGVVACAAPVVAAYVIKRAFSGSSIPEQAPLAREVQALGAGTVKQEEVLRFLRDHPETAQIINEKCPELVEQLKRPLKEKLIANVELP